MKPPYVLIDRLLCRNPAEFVEFQVCGLRASHRCLWHIPLMLRRQGMGVNSIQLQVGGDLKGT